MPNYWLLKSEPMTYSFDTLMKDKKTVWDGVSSFAALKHMRSMKKGDLAFVYHSGDEKAVVGIAQIESAAYPNPNENDERLVVFDLKAKEKLKKPVPLAAIKADKAFAQFHLVRIPRLSVMPVEKKLWDLILKMSK
ncbi:MAG: EVE domain-containing protein [Ignavibacteriae bacterium]|nr:EVE domain-containing protein [Ignavibacteriota bacterium]